MRYLRSHFLVITYASTVLLFFAPVSSQAALSPVFEYQFPASYDGTTTTLTDVSGAGHHGVLESTGAFLPDFRPDGFTSGGSIHGLLGGYGKTAGIDLISRSLIAANGGFTMDTWVRWDEEDLVEGVVPTTQIISYAGTEALMAVSGHLAMNVYLADELDNYVQHLKFGPVIEVGRWYHIVGTFNSEGNTVDGNGNLQGELFFIVDGQVQDTENVIAGPLHSIGDDIDRQIAINAHPGDFGSPIGSTGFVGTGKVFNPSVYLGAIELPMGTPGDFDLDGDVDGQDFLMWQRGESPGGNAVGSTDLADWQANYGIGPLQANVTSVPEPTAVSLLAISIAALAMAPRRSN